MKTNVMKMFLALSTVTLFGGALNAQTYRLNANIPFAFQAANETFAPGVYTVRQAGTETVPSLAPVAKGHKIYIAGSYASLGPGKSAKLVFHCCGPDKCFLAEIWPVTSFRSFRSEVER